jgi:O-Antigen ligase
MVLSQDWRLAGVLSASAIMLGVGVVLSPMLALLGLGAVVILFAGIVFPGSLTRTFIRLLVLLLLGYAFFDRAFAHIAVGPIYVGEVVLFTGLLSALTDKRRFLAFRSPLAWLIVLFMLWGAIRTFPYVPVYGKDAIRDGATWGYALFALLVAPLLMSSERLAGLALEKWGRWAPYFLVWAPLGWFLTYVLAAHLPKGDNGEPLQLEKPGDAAVHLVGVAVLILLHLDRSHPGQDEKDSPRRKHEWLWWLLWAAGVFAVGNDARSGLLAVLMALGVATVLRPMRVGRKLVLVGTIAAALLMTVVAADISIRVGKHNRYGARSVSVDQLLDNLESLTGGGRADLASTSTWRLIWWRKIINYTIHGPYFWEGKGYGINLAHDDGIRQVRSDRTVRNPHSIHLTMLARGGVIGLAVWIVLQGVFGVSMLRALLRARRLKDGWWERVNLWILTYWLAFLVNASFDVYLEGPQAGIWFWCLFGFGIAALEIQRQKYARRASAYELAASGPRPAFALRTNGLPSAPSLSARQHAS